MQEDRTQPPRLPKRQGGYDDGYEQCSTFWPDHPGSVLAWLAGQRSLRNLRVLDLGCGEGTNAAWLAAQGCQVTAVDVSAAALRNALAKYPQSSIDWQHADAMSVAYRSESFDLIVAYGLLHCITEPESVELVQRMKQWTRVHGINVIVAFNDRSQDLSGHPGFHPTLRTHSSFVSQYSDWALLFETDQDLHETHPHNKIPHHHSMTRIAAARLG